MKSIVIASISGVIGIIAGCVVHARFFDVRTEIQSLMQGDITGSHGAALVSLSTLLALESGETDRAKLQLARQIASYQHSFGDYDGSLPGRPRLMPLIQDASAKSAILRDELRKTPD